MSKIKKQKNISAPKKVQEPIGGRIAKAVYEAKKISERIFGYISYDIKFVRAVYSGKTQRPAKITALEKGIVGILQVDETSSFENIGSILGLDVVNDKAEQSILRSAIETLRGFNAIEGDDSLLALTEGGRAYADKGERPDSYTKEFDIYVDLSHPAWYNIKNGIGDNVKKIEEINTPCDNLNLDIDQIRAYAEQQAQDVHFPQNRYLLENATWSEGHEASYKVYVCFVQNVANSEEVRAFVYDENSESLNDTIAEQINNDEALKSELLSNCIRLECENDEETTVLEGEAVEVAKAEITEELKQAEQRIIEEESGESSTDFADEQEAEEESEISADSTKPNKSPQKNRLHKKALYDSLSFEVELQKIFTEDDPDEIWLISPWIRKGAFLHDRGPMIENFLSDETKRVFIAYSEPATNNDGKPMMDEEVEPGIKLLEDQYPNFFYVQLPEFHLKNVIEVKDDQKILFSGSFNVLSFSVSEQQTHVRREEMALAHYTVAKKKYDDCQLEFAEIYADRIKKQIELLESSEVVNYKNEKLEYFLGIENAEIHKLFSPIEDLIEEKNIAAVKSQAIKSLSTIDQQLIVASNMGGLNLKDRKRYMLSLESIANELSSNSIDDPSTIEMFSNVRKRLDSVPEKKIFPGKTQRVEVPQNNGVGNNLDITNSSLNEFASAIIEGNEPTSSDELDKHLLALFYCVTRKLIKKNDLIHTYLKNYVVNYSELYDGLLIETSATNDGAFDITFIVAKHSFKFRNLRFSDSLRDKWAPYVKCDNASKRLFFVTTQNVEDMLSKYKD